MNSQLSIKIRAVVVALLLNCLMMGGAAFFLVRAEKECSVLKSASHAADYPGRQSRVFSSFMRL
jgi:hypothetical protein